MKQRRHLSNKISAVFAASILSISLTGVTCGSFAWFTYMTRAKIEEFQGVTIGINELEIGFRLENDLADAEHYGLIKDDSRPDQTIYWFHGHQIEPETINYILSSSGYATDTLIPATTKKYAKGDDFNLFSTPRIYSKEYEEVRKKDYIYLPLVFRCKDIIEEDTYLSNEDIFLSQVKMNTFDTNSRIHEAIRIYTSNTIDNSHLINPSSSNDGTTDVGGVLDLDGDGFYDSLSDESGNDVYEHIYGQVVEPRYKPLPESDDTIVYPDQRTTFNAGHRAGVYAVDTDALKPEVAAYEGFYGFRNKRKPVTTTNQLTDNLAYLDLSIFIEGWDTHVIDSEIEIPFSMELKFEITL